MTLLSRPILVLADHAGSDANGWTLTPASAQVITLARALTCAEVVAVSLTATPDVAALSALGVSGALVPDLAESTPRVSAVVADVVAECLKDRDFGALLLVSTYRGREVASRIATLVDSAAVSDATGVEAGPDGLEITTTALAGTWASRLRITGDLPIIAVKPGSVDAEPVGAPSSPEIRVVDVDLSAEAAAVTVVSSSVQSGDGRVSLADASTVVCAGRGINADMTIVENLADALSGAIGATRVVCDEGWAPRSMQIGQTGVSVNPNLYIGLGVSGAIHHTVGMQSSAHIVAVCDDPDAPIFEIADFGVVGDVFEVIPQALEEIARVRGPQ